MNFFIGLDNPSHAWPFKRSMISINRIRDRKSDFLVNEWLMDSGAFTEISTHGRWRSPVEDYAKQILRWSNCGTMLAAVAQDYMCEDDILQKTGLSISEHQRLTTERYRQLIGLVGVPVLPVLQGYHPKEYSAHVELYGQLLKPGAWVGVGSVCKRNSNPETVEDVLRSIKAKRQDLRLHGFGLKITALENPAVRSLLHSSDSMAWSFHGRKNDDAHDPRLPCPIAPKSRQLQIVQLSFKTVCSSGGSMIKTQPNEKRCASTIERHEFELSPCCPVTKNPQAGSFLKIRYRPEATILEVQSLHDYVREYIGGRLDVRSMEGMIQNIAQDCANAISVKVKVTAALNLIPRQKMRLVCKAWPQPHKILASTL